jgi:hypothetical protein
VISMGRNSKSRTDREAAKAVALQLPDVELGSHHGTMDLRVHNRIFAKFPANTKVVVVRRDDEWAEVSLDDIDHDTLRKLLIDSWLAVAPLPVRRLHEGTLANRVR